MSEEKEYRMEFRAYKDEAWYTARVLLDKEVLSVKYLNFPEEYDTAFRASEFSDPKKLEDLAQRFRPLSKQVQDRECGLLAEGVRVCACHLFADDDLRFHDAFVDGVQRKKHSWKEGNESCSCTFILCWLQGPNEGSLTAASIGDICIVQPEQKLNLVVASFLEMAREKMRLLSSHSVSVSKRISCSEMVQFRNKSSNITSGVGYFDQTRKEKRRGKQSVVKVCPPEVSCYDREDRDLEGTKDVCMILIANMDRELSPSTITEFLYRHTSISASVFIFPNLSSEVYTRGAIILDSEKRFQELCDFLNNPNCIITSSTGRPWVILDKQVGLQNIKASIGTLVHLSKNTLQKGKSGTRSNLKVVHSGTPEFKIASDMRNLFLEFSNHQTRLHKRLVLEERRVSLKGFRIFVALMLVALELSSMLRNMVFVRFTSLVSEKQNLSVVKLVHHRLSHSRIQL
ncbi:hypothetical protein VNO78_07230 [Psophocarpus tetragonolobus]|uniref:SAWADEE domain-containing protein n=1 Tax=Psophocarpus tetragonolobus TaxID=3891 RepID=A0AAN9ST62_PSOTE